MVYYWFFCTPQRGGSGFLSWHLSFFCLYCWLYKIILKNYIKGSLNISGHLSMNIILVDPNLVRIFFLVKFFLIVTVVRTLENNYFLLCTKLGYLWYKYSTKTFPEKFRKFIWKQMRRSPIFNEVSSSKATALWKETSISCRFSKNFQYKFSIKHLRDTFLKEMYK